MTTRPIKYRTSEHDSSVRKLQNCPYKKLCIDFFKSLNLDDKLFNPVYNMCYCNKCIQERGDNHYYKRGRPPKQYGLPIGWVRFGITLQEGRAATWNVYDKWHRAFHGTHQQHLKGILEVGQLVVPGNEVVFGGQIKELEGHYNDSKKPNPDFDTKQIFVSPSILYAGSGAYAKKESWTHGQKNYWAQVAFQLFIEPSSYKVGKGTTREALQGIRIDPHYSNAELEWSTDKPGSTMIYGLLVKVEKK